MSSLHLPLSKGADPNIVSNQGTALDMVEHGGFFEYEHGKPVEKNDPRISAIRKLLLDHGAKKRYELPGDAPLFDQQKYLAEHPEYKPRR